MRCADFGPTPGRQRSASISASRPDGFTGLERQFEARGQIHACRESGHLFLAQFLSTANCIVYCRSDQIFEHFAIVKNRRIDVYAAYVMSAGHHDLDHAGARLAHRLPVAVLKRVFAGALIVLSANRLHTLTAG